MLSDEEKAEDREESGWKLVHADVFRPPDKLPMLFCVCVGRGVQVLLCAASHLIFAAAGFLSPNIWARLATAVFVLFVMMGIFAGYASALRYTKHLKGGCGRSARCAPRSRFLAFVFARSSPSTRFCTERLDGGRARSSSSGIFLALWFGVSVPLVFVGAYLGYKREPLAYPTITSNILKGSAHAPALVPERVVHDDGRRHLTLRGVLRRAVLYSLEHVDGPVLLRVWVYWGWCLSFS